ncbi:MAG: lactate utilization protein C [Desulfovibrionales bacterium]
MSQDEQVRIFSAQAVKAGSAVHVVTSFDEVHSYLLDICDKKQACRLVVSGCDEELSSPAESLCRTKEKKSIAAPGYPQPHAAQLEELCLQQDVRFIQEELRSHAGGIDIGLTVVQYGIAETGSLVLDATNEDLRLATMIPEIHMAVLPVEMVFDDETGFLQEFSTRDTTRASYWSFITGPSRTADIERVLTIGVHGPLELHILLLEEKS